MLIYYIIVWRSFLFNLTQSIKLFLYKESKTLFALKILQKQPPEVFCKKRCPQKFRKNPQENTSTRVSFLRKLQASIFKKETLTQMFSCEFCEISKNAFSYGTPLGDYFWYFQHLLSFFPINFRLVFN